MKIFLHSRRFRLGFDRLKNIGRRLIFQYKFYLVSMFAKKIVMNGFKKRRHMHISIAFKQNAIWIHDSFNVFNKHENIFKLYMTSQLNF